MAEKIKLLELDIDTGAVIAKSVELRDNLAKSREELDKLKKAEGDNTAEIVKLEASIRKLNSEYNNNQKVVSALVSANGKSIPISEKVNLLLNEENTTRLKAKQAITEMNKLKDELNVNVKEEAALLDSLNKKINEQTEFLRRTGSEEDKRILNIGRYKEGVTAAIQETGLFEGQLEGVTRVYETGTKVISPFTEGITSNWKAMKTSSAETEGMTTAQKGLTIATNTGTGAMRIFALAVAATGIGLIVIAIALLIGYFRTFDPLVDKIEQGFAAFGAVIRVIQQTIVGFISNLKSVGDLFNKIGSFIKDPIGALEEVGKKMEDAAKAAAALKEAQQDLADQQAIQSVANKRQQAEIDRLILQSKDRSKTEEERIALLEKAEKLNRQNFAVNADLAKKELDNAIEAARIKGDLTDQEVSNLRRLGVEYAFKLLNQGKITQEEVDMLTKAEELKIDIYARSTSEQEKIINRQNALIEKAEAAAEERRKKAEEARKKALDDTAKIAKAELDLFLSQQGIRAKSLQEEIAIAEKVRDQRIKIAQAEFNASEKSKADRLKLLTEENNARDEFLKKQVDSVVTNASRELQAFIDANVSKIDAQKFFSELSLQEEQRRIDLIAEKQKNFEALRLEQGVITEFEYQQAIKQIQDDAQAQRDEAAALRQQAETERKAIDLENQRAFEDIVFQENQEILLQRLEQQRLNEVAAAEKSGADINLINKKYAAAKTKLERDTEAAKLDLSRQTLGEINALVTGFFGENKMLSAALASTDAILGAQKAYVSQLIPGDPTSVGRATLAAIKAGAFGALNVAKILGVKFEKGDILEGPSHSNGGIPFTINGVPGFEAEGGEAIINKRSTAMFRPLLSYLNQLGGGKKFANGGFVTTTGITSSLNSLQRTQTFDYDLLSSKIAEANRSLPPNNLSLEYFNNEMNNLNSTVNISNHG